MLFLCLKWEVNCCLVLVSETKKIEHLVTTCYILFCVCSFIKFPNKSWDLRFYSMFLRMTTWCVILLRKALGGHILVISSTIMKENKQERGRVGGYNVSYRAPSLAKTVNETLVMKDDNMFLYTQLHYI